VSAAELEEIGLPDFGLDRSATLEIAVGQASALLSVVETGVLRVEWRGPGGERLKTLPAAIKQAHAPALRAVKAKAKEIDRTLRAQRLRLEGLYLSERILGVDLWRERYLDTPLVAGLARRLIWSFEIGSSWVGAVPLDGELIDSAGARVRVPSTTRVKLWHPMQSEPAEILAWRRRLQSFSVTQPFKQAHREVYVLTDAERETNLFSNRFAGHIVDQHRLRALCQARGWQSPMFGYWEPAGVPSKHLADRGLGISFDVEPAEETMNPDGVIQHVVTDRVRFATASGAPLALDAVDPVVFSEAMRDADLFVSVAGIASDPTWPDRGDTFGGYWARAASGALTETGKTRHVVLKDLLPGLTIAARCRLEETHLVVEGKLRTYRIHLGSGNVMMEPDSQFLCIVQDRSEAAGQVWLPFDGDDLLALILSKAFLLVDDDRIRDASILSQIMRGR
jgi:hypothetical protein